MLKDAVAILDIGSSKSVAIIGERAVNNNFTIRAISEKEHEAFYDGKIEDFISLEESVLGAIEEVTNSAKVSVNELYVGVPGEFLKIKNKQYQILLNKKRKIKQKDIDELYDGALNSITEPEHEVIDKSAVYYFVDGNQRVSGPLGVSSESLAGYLTYYLCPKEFLTAIKSILAKAKIKNVNFVPVPLAESLYLFNRQERYAYVLMVDVGYITTSVSIVLGDGMLYQGSFPIGGGHITAYLREKLNIDFSLAEKLKRKINLSVSEKISGSYEVFVGDEQYIFDIKACNDIVCSVLDGISEEIEKQFTNSQVKLPHGNNVALSLTGGGVCFIRGAKEYISRRIEMGVNVISPNIPFMNKPDESSKLSLLDYSLNAKLKK